MGSRRHTKKRCDGCCLHPELCVCAERPLIHTQTNVVLIQHYKESFRPTSTGTLVAKMLSNCERYMYGAQNQPFDLTIFDKHPQAIILYPHQTACSIVEVSSLPFPVSTIFFVDGTWSEARRVMNRLDIADRMPCFTLDVMPPSNWKVRREVHKGGLATLEAIAETLGIIESPEIKNAMLEYFYHVTLQIFKMRGKKHPTL
jgi:DTW domain-containing protein